MLPVIWYASLGPAFRLHYAQSNMSKHFYSFISRPRIHFSVWTGVRGDFLHTVHCTCYLWALFPALPPHYDLQAAPSAVDQLNKQTILISLIKQQFDCTWEHATFDFLSSIQPAWDTHERTSKLLTLLIWEGRWVIQPSTVCALISVCLLCSFFLSRPFSSTFICPPEGRSLTTGWGSMNCCVVLSQRRILFRSPPGG